MNKIWRLLSSKRDELPVAQGNAPSVTVQLLVDLPSPGIGAKGPVRPAETVLPPVRHIHHREGAIRLEFKPSCRSASVVSALLPHFRKGILIRPPGADQ